MTAVFKDPLESNAAVLISNVEVLEYLAVILLLHILNPLRIPLKRLLVVEVELAPVKGHPCTLVDTLGVKGDQGGQVDLAVEDLVKCLLGLQLS